MATLKTHLRDVTNAADTTPRIFSKRNGPNAAEQQPHKLQPPPPPPPHSTKAAGLLTRHIARNAHRDQGATPTHIQPPPRSAKPTTPARTQSVLPFAAELSVFPPEADEHPSSPDDGGPASRTRSSLTPVRRAWPRSRASSSAATATAAASPGNCANELKASEQERLRLQRALIVAKRAAQEAIASSQTQAHPNFGKLLVDLGHKKVYLASARTFVGSVPIWARQRPCNEGRIREITQAKGKAPEFIGSISCFEMMGHSQPSLRCSQPCGIFDGQHRAKAVANLLGSEDFIIEDDAGSPDAARGQFHDFEIVVEVFPVRSEAEINTLYLEVNKSESVKEIDMPDAIAPVRKTAIDKAVGLLQQRFGDMFKPSERCRPPHVHRDTLRNKLFQHPSTEFVESAEELFESILRLNTSLGRLPKKTWAARVHKALDKANLHCFWLGLDEYAWLDRLPVISS